MLTRTVFSERKRENINVSHTHKADLWYLLFYLEPLLIFPTTITPVSFIWDSPPETPLGVQ